MLNDRTTPYNLSQEFLPLQGRTLPVTSVAGEIREPAASYVTATATEPVASEPIWRPEVAAQAAPYSIRIPSPAGEVACPRCGSFFLATGPTGFAGERPICDLCLFEASHPLGMLSALGAVVRTFGVLEPVGEEYRELSQELAAFARIYERVAAKSGPPRPFRLPQFEI